MPVGNIDKNHGMSMQGICALFITTTDDSQYLKINVFGKNISVLVSGLDKEVGRLHFYLYNQKKLSKPNINPSS